MEQGGKVIYLVANWKSHKTLAEALSWLEAMKDWKGNEETKVIVCPPLPYLRSMHQVIMHYSLPLELGTQDISPFPLGAYTGAVSAAMVKEWVTYAIVGHSERRHYFHETDQEVANKVTQCLDNGLRPILCIDEPYLESQINTLNDIPKEKLIVAYEPLAAIGSGNPDTPEHAQAVAERVKAAIRADVPVLYGGSVTVENIRAYSVMPAINGVLVGGASLNPEVWKALAG